MFGIFTKKNTVKKNILTGKSEGFECGKYIDISELGCEFSLEMISNGIVNDCVENSYAQLVYRTMSPSAYSPFQEIIDMCIEFNSSNDLVKKHNAGLSSNVESLVFMANAYAQRAAVYGEILRSGVDKESLNMLSNVQFKFSQIRTFQNIDFQKAASLCSTSLINKVDEGINAEGLRRYMNCAIDNQEKIVSLWETRYYIEIDPIYQFLDYCSELENVTVDQINGFIITHQKKKP